MLQSTVLVPGPAKGVGGFESLCEQYMTNQSLVPRLVCVACLMGCDTDRRHAV